MYCPNCGTENKEGSIYCNLCQEPLQKYSGAPPVGQPMAPLPGPISGPPSQSPLVPPGEGFGQGGPPPPPYGGAPYPTQGPAFQTGPANQQPYPAYPAYPGYPQYPGYPGYQGYPPYPVVVAQAAATPGEATASLVLGIVGIFICPIICSILAIVYGIKAKNMIDASGGYMGGRGVAQAGLVLGIVGMVLYTITLIFYAATGFSTTSLLMLLMFF
jgi:hypothetical protein